MGNFKKGDILHGKKRGSKQAYHPIVFIDGTDQIPIAVILTDSDRYSCNKKMSPNHFEVGHKVGYKKDSHFVMHKIEKLVMWGPYKKVGCLTKEGITFVENNIVDSQVITWQDYEIRKENGCPEHG
jgi:hypothetical protein